MITVFPHTPDVVKLWATGGQKYAKNKSGNLFFEGDTIYSYGIHYPLARRFKRPGGDLYLLNCAHYSKTTDRHKRLVISHLGTRLIEVPMVRPLDHHANVRNFNAHLIWLGKKMRAARKSAEWYHVQINQTIYWANAYCSFFRIKYVFSLADAGTIQMEFPFDS